MATAEIRNALGIVTANSSTKLAVQVLADRIVAMSPAEQADVTSLASELSHCTSDEDRAVVLTALVELLEGPQEGDKLVTLHEPSPPPEGYLKWVDWVSSQLRKARSEAGLTQSQLAERTGLPQSHISRIENGKHSPSRSTLERIAVALDKPLKTFDPSAPDESGNDS